MAIVRDLTGLRFGRLLVVEKAGLKRRSDGRNRTTWLCVCDCGNEVVADNSILVHGGKKSCGCLALEDSIEKCLEQAKKNRKAPGYSALSKVYSNYRSSARQRGLEFCITREDFARLTALPCHYCGALPSNTQTNTAGTFIYNGLDRVNSKRGYVLDNLVPCCTSCNFLKGRSTVEKFLKRLEEKRIANIMNAIKGR